jgi:hypothetical protein
VNPLAVHPVANYRFNNSDFPLPVFDKNLDILHATITRDPETPGDTYNLSADDSS